MNRTQARKELRTIFPCYIDARIYCSYEALRRNDSQMVNYMLDCIEWNQPIQNKITRINEVME